MCVCVCVCVCERKKYLDERKRQSAEDGPVEDVNAVDSGVGVGLVVEDLPGNVVLAGADGLDEVEAQRVRGLDHLHDKLVTNYKLAKVKHKPLAEPPLDRGLEVHANLCLCVCVCVCECVCV